MTLTTDETIRSMLAARAERYGPDVDVAAVLRQLPQRRSLPWRWQPMGATAAVGAVVLIVAAVAVGQPRPGPLALSSPTTPASRAAPASAPADGPTALTHLTPQQLGDFARSRSEELAGRLAVARGTVAIVGVREIKSDCVRQACARALMNDAGAGFELRPSVDAVTNLPAGRRGSTGWFLVRFTSDRGRDGPVVELVGSLVSAREEDWAISVAAILATDPGRTGDYAAVDGWLVHEPLHPCPSLIGSSPDDPVYGCPDLEYLTDHRFQPLQQDGSSIGASDAIVLPIHAYATWAPDPQVAGTGVEPRRAVYVLRRQDQPCHDTGFCIPSPNRWGTIVGVVPPLSDSAPGDPQRSTGPGGDDPRAPATGRDPESCGPLPSGSRCV